jgi:1-deoxy-D-xylulose-5-phosphate synthase
MDLLSRIDSPDAVKQLSRTELVQLADEIRQFLIGLFAERGGHVGPNLGIIEATIALHYVFNSPVDKLIWDVSHQCLPHKILTGRLEILKKFHQDGGTSPFTAPEESDHDHFIIGHTSTAISLATGLAKGRDLLGGTENVIAIMGDGSLSGGQAWEGLNIGGTLNSNFIVIFNDNEMSIDYNSGGIYSGLAKLRETKGQSGDNIFKFLGYDYLYVEGGNEIGDLITAFEQVKDATHPIVVHIHTRKGLGLKWAEESPNAWHYHTPFDPETGQSAVAVDKNRAIVVNSVDTTVDFFAQNEDVVAVVPGTPLLGGKANHAWSDRYFDVGIAEASGISFASAIAKRGVKPFVVVASCFIERAYDQIMQDWLVNQTPASLIVLGAGLTRSDASHIGIHDIPMLGNMPGLVYLTPTTNAEYLDMLHWCKIQPFPTAIRLPGGMIEDNYHLQHRELAPIEGYYGTISSTTANSESVIGHTITGSVIPKTEFIAKAEVVERGEKVALIGAGIFFDRAVDVAKLLQEQHNLTPTLVNPRFISHLDTELLNELKRNHQVVVTFEDGVTEGGFGSKVANYFSASDVRVLIKGVRKEFIDSVKYGTLTDRYRLGAEQVVEDVVVLLNQCE